MTELGSLILGAAVLLHLRHTWQALGLADQRVHVLALFLLGSVVLTAGAWAHRLEWMGLTVACAAAPGLVTLWALWRKAHVRFEEMRRNPARLGR